VKAELKLHESISSLQDLKGLILELRDYSKWFAHNAIKQRVGAKSKAKNQEPTLSDAANAAIRAWTTKASLSDKSLGELIAALEGYALSAPQFTIVLAGPPSAGLKKTIVAWCRDNVAPHILVNFQFNSTLLGGLVVRSGSHVYDWSFRRQILDNRAKFPETLRHV